MDQKKSTDMMTNFYEMKEKLNIQIKSNDM